MNYLQMVQRLRQETGYANAGPTSVTGQVGDHARGVSWIADAHTELQNRHLWRWLRKEFTLTASSGQASYDYTSAIDTPTGAAISRFRRWVLDARNPMRCYLQSSGIGTEYWLTPISWDCFRSIYQIGTQADSAPAHITVDPSDQLVLGPTPNAAYVVSGEYHRGAQVLTGDNDVPEMPSDYHMAIVYSAMQDHGFFDAATEIHGRGFEKLRRLTRQLESTQLPQMRRAGPMA